MKQMLMLAALAAAVLAAPALSQPAALDEDALVTELIVNAISDREIVVGEQVLPFNRGQVRILDTDGSMVADLRALTGPFHAQATYRGVESDGRHRLVELAVLVRYEIDGDGRMSPVRWVPAMEERVRREVR